MNSDSKFVETLLSILGYFKDLLQQATINFIITFQNYNTIDFLVALYIGHIIGTLLGKFFRLLDERHGWFYIVSGFFFYIIFFNCAIETAHPLCFGIVLSFGILFIINILQRPKNITYKDFALMFPISSDIYTTDL